MSPLSLALLLLVVSAATAVVYVYSMRLIHASERPYTVEDLEETSSRISQGGASVEGGIYVEMFPAEMRLGPRKYVLRLVRITVQGCRGLTLNPSAFNSTLAPWGNGTFCGLSSRISLKNMGDIVIAEYYTANFTGQASCIETSTNKTILDAWAVDVTTPWQKFVSEKPTRVVLISHVISRC